MAGAPHNSTLSATGEPREKHGAGRTPHLFLVLESHRPLAPPLRIALDGIDEVVFGRGAERAVERADEGSVRRLVVRLPDPWLSSRHARLARVMRRWGVEDLGSKNGTFVDGVRTARAEVEDGQHVELGHTFWIFREGIERDPGDPPVVEAATAEPPARGLATLLPELGRVFASLAPIARAAVPVVVQGETGTGKEVIARAIHALSGRPGDLVAVNCGALPKDLVEGELFGHRRGAFSGALEDRPGLVRAADRGTLLLDEIGDLPLAAQAALLRVLQEREVRPLGSTRSLPVDLRVVSATHRPLDRLVEEGAFRADLLSRLSGYRLTLPPLRERREDLGLILADLVREEAGDDAAEVRLHPRAARALLRHDWPGNVRELGRCLGAALALAPERRVGVEHLPEAVQRALDGGAAAQHEEDEARRRSLVELLREHRGNVTAVATALGKARMQVQRWLKRYEIDPDAFRRL